MIEIFKTLAKYKQQLEQQGYNVIYIGLYGSQNYSLHDEYSDIDCKAIVLPTLHDIIFRKATSKVVEMDNGAIDVKDLITFYDVIRKGNFSYIESIDTKYFIGDKYIKELFMNIRPNLKSMLGAMHEKRKALTHEFPSKHVEFEKWGFDPKQLHHIIRLSQLLGHNVREGDTKSYIDYFDNLHWQQVLIDVKRNKTKLNVATAVSYADYYIEFAKTLIPSDYVYIPCDYSKEISDYIEKHIKLELLKDSPTVSAREYRTFDNGVPKKDLEKFKELEKYKDKDISYIVYESLEIL